MSAILRWWCAPCFAVLAAAVFSLDGASAANKVPKIKPQVAETVEFFAGVESNKVGAKLIPRDSRRATVWIENKTDKPLKIRMPAAFAGVPVLAQFGPPGGFPPPGGAAPQGVGFPGNNFPGMDFGGGLPFFSVPSGKTIKTRVDCVCLDHGKPEPRPRVPYKIVALDTVNERPELAELIESLGKGQASQRVVQAAAWHLANDMSWEQLDAKRIKRLSGIQQRWFHPNEIAAAKRLVERLPSVRAKSKKKDSESDSLAGRGQGVPHGGYCLVGVSGIAPSAGSARGGR